MIKAIQPGVAFRMWMQTPAGAYRIYRYKEESTAMCAQRIAKTMGWKADYSKPKNHYILVVKSDFPPSMEATIAFNNAVKLKKC